MYWNDLEKEVKNLVAEININMRCIEILTVWGIDKCYGD